MAHFLCDDFLACLRVSPSFSIGPRRSCLGFSTKRNPCLFSVGFWSAANGGLRGVWPPVLEIGRNRPFSPFFCLFCPFPEGRRAPGKSRKRRKKAFFLRYPGISLNPHLLNPHLRHPKVSLHYIFFRLLSLFGRLFLSYMRQALGFFLANAPCD